MQSLLADWQGHHQFVRDVFPDRPVGYFGLSLGTQYGIPFVAEQPDIRAACFGLFGSQPAPKTPVMNHYAPRVSCPAFFVQQLDDEIHPVATTTHLYDSLGSADKVLSASPGLHAELPAETFRLAVNFVAGHLLG